MWKSIAFTPGKARKVPRSPNNVAEAVREGARHNPSYQLIIDQPDLFVFTLDMSSMYGRPHLVIWWKEN